MPSSAASSWPWPASSRGEGTSSPASPHRHRVRPRPSPPRVSVKRALAPHVGPAAGGPSVPALALLPNGKHLFGLGEIRFHMETTDGAPEEGWGCGDGHRVGRGAGLPGRSPRGSYTGFPKQKGSWCRERGAASAAGAGELDRPAACPLRPCRAVEKGSGPRPTPSPSHLPSDHWMEAGSAEGALPEPVETCSFCFPERRQPTQESAGGPGTPGGAARSGRWGRLGRTAIGQPCARAPQGGLEVLCAPAEEGGPTS